jgi:hypothetical protein
VLLVVVTWPNPPWDAIWVISVVMMILTPIIFYPFSKTIWLAIDLGFLQPLGISLD